MEDDPRGAPSEPETAEASGSRTELRPARGRTFLPDVTDVHFTSSRRGYDRAEVDGYVERVSRIVVELEAMRSPDAVIERALADVGEETSAILRRARKAAEEIIGDAESHAQERSSAAEAQSRQMREDADHYSAKTRADAEEVLAAARAEADRVQREARSEADKVLGEARAEGERIHSQAEAEAGRTRTAADRYQQQVSTHIEQLAQERHRLIEDLRKLADQFHRTADRALEQIPSQEIPYEGVEGNGGSVSAETRSA